ncbi:DNA-binding protein [Mycobacterium xenopi RIVM700367]|nr:DNA-binding protein [Mycobacterium xenopi RIVM700367]
MTDSTVGGLLRGWRERRRVSQLELSLQVGVSARHLSFIETGRSRPSAETVLALAGPGRYRAASRQMRPSSSPDGERPRISHGCKRQPRGIDAAGT